MQFRRSNVQMQYIYSSLFLYFEHIRKSKQFNSSYLADAIHPNLTYPLFLKMNHQKGLLEQIKKKTEFLLLSPDSRKLLTTSLKTVNCRRRVFYIQEKHSWSFLGQYHFVFFSKGDFLILPVAYFFIFTSKEAWK